MNKKFRAWDGEHYWYATDHLIFINGFQALELLQAPFELKDVEQFTGKIDSKGTMIYENDIIMMTHADKPQTYQVIWADKACGFRKVPHGMPLPETKIDEAFMQVIGTIHSKE